MPQGSEIFLKDDDFDAETIIEEERATREALIMYLVDKTGLRKEDADDMLYMFGLWISWRSRMRPGLAPGN
jgi:hypothetical protein